MTPPIRILPTLILFCLVIALLPTAASAVSTQPTEAGTLPFLPAATYETGGDEPTAIAAGDLNGDSILDIVVTNRGSVGVLLSNGDDTFQPAVTYPADGTYAYALALGDVNRDGKLDTLVAHGNGVVEVFLGNGNGSLQSPGSYDSWGYGTRALVLQDLNADGIADLVVANRCSGETDCSAAISILLGNGDGTFQNPTVYNSTIGGAASVAVADVDRDGKPDLIVSYFTSCRGCADSLRVLLGKGDGTFRDFLTDTGLGGGAIAASDVNGDGNPDLLITGACVSYGNCESNLIGVMLGVGDGMFYAPVNYASGGFHPAALVVADLNADQKPDLSIANGCSFRGHQCQSGNIAILVGNGDGTFQPAVTYEPGGHYLKSLAVADVNGDGRPDIMATNYRNYYSMYTVGVLLNNDGPHSATVTTLVSSQNPAPPGVPITFTSTVTSQDGKVLRGFLTFFSGYHPMARVPVVNGQATYTLDARNYGTKWIGVDYSGDTRNAESSTGLIQYIKAFPIQTILKLSASPSPSVAGQPVTFTAKLSTYGNIPDGELVTFTDWKTPLASVPVASGVATYTTSSLSIGSHFIFATYGGDSVYRKASAHLNLVVNSSKK